MFGFWQLIFFARKLFFQFLSKIRRLCFRTWNTTPEKIGKFLFLPDSVQCYFCNSASDTNLCFDSWSKRIFLSKKLSVIYKLFQKWFKAHFVLHVFFIFCSVMSVFFFVRQLAKLNLRSIAKDAKLRFLFA